MKKIFTLILALLVIFCFSSCTEKTIKATPEEIAEYQLILKANEVKAKYHNKESTAYQKESTIRDWISEAHYDIYSINLSTNEIYVDYAKIFSDGNELGELLKTIYSEHLESHTSITPESDDWEYWVKSNLMDGYYTCYIINDDGTYDKKNSGSIFAERQYCPFCIYSLMTYQETGSFQQATRWPDLYYFSPENYGLSGWASTGMERYKKKLQDDPDFIIEKRDYLIANTYNLFDLRSLENRLKEVYLSAAIPDWDEFRKKYNGLTVKIQIKMQGISKSRISDNLSDYDITTNDYLHCHVYGLKKEGSYPYYLLKDNSIESKSVEYGLSGYVWRDDKLLDFRKYSYHDKLATLKPGDTIELLANVILEPYFYSTDLNFIDYLDCCEIISVNGEPF